MRREYKGTVQIDSHRTPIHVNLLPGKRANCEMKNSVPEQDEESNTGVPSLGSCSEFNRTPSSAAGDLSCPECEPDFQF